MEIKTWIIVADVAQAKLFVTHKASLFNGHGKLTLINHYEHPASRKRDSELVTDKQGRFGKATFVEQTDPKRHEEEIFARELANNLEKAFHEKQYQDLILIAPPTFMGMLKAHFPDAMTKLISLSLEKNYTRSTPEELITHLQPYL